MKDKLEEFLKVRAQLEKKIKETQGFLQQAFIEYHKLQGKIELLESIEQPPEG